MPSLESGIFHLCSEVSEAFTTRPGGVPIFEPRLAKDLATGEDIRVVLMHIQGAYSYQTIQVDYCPWCGAQLTPFTLARSMKFRRELADYREYRKRWVKQGTPAAPMNFKEWQHAANDFDEIDFLLRHARPQFTDGLMRQKQRLRDRLALGVVLDPDTMRQEPAEEGKEQAS